MIGCAFPICREDVCDLHTVFTLIFMRITSTFTSTSENGAKSWYIVPGIGSIQPSEYMKIF
ncbi:FtsW/RodA/SpoVE family cell cycle protein [Metabacillus halosaccharovorans]|uniref:FtsW/RodA/SpoVE family cell cycle protein n=1 Tax=Metabacillus halosaccharovorans TaxID=930124 RepID=UPI003D3383B1|nr:hypothetical protein [Metabacillus halosaccharovorans]